MNTMFSKLWSIIFYYVLVGLLFNAWNVTSWSTESKLFLLIAFVANGLGELATEVVKEMQYNRRANSGVADSFTLNRPDKY